MLCYITVMLLTTLISYGVSSPVTFRPSATTDLRHLAVDSQTGTVYVGAVNHLYQLNGNLTLVVDVVTGPVQDNKNCINFNSTTGRPNCKTLQLAATDNYNQVQTWLL